MNPILNGAPWLIAHRSMLEINRPLKVPWIENAIERSLVESTARIVEQDSSNVESLYPRQKPKIRLPKEEIMSYVEKLYHNWE